MDFRAIGGGDKGSHLSNRISLVQATGRNRTTGKGNSSDLGSNFMVLSGTSVFLQTGHSCLGTLNCLFPIVQEWAFYYFKDIGLCFLKGQEPSAPRGMLVVNQKGCELQ